MCQITFSRPVSGTKMDGSDHTHGRQIWPIYKANLKGGQPSGYFYQSSLNLMEAHGAFSIIPGDTRLQADTTEPLGSVQGWPLYSWPAFPVSCKPVMCL